MEDTATMKATVSGILLDALADLGETTEAAAAHLESIGLKGTRKCPHSCILHSYLAAHGTLPDFGTEYLLEIGFNEVRVRRYMRNGEHETWERVPLMPHLRALIEDFDEGKYPMLDANRDAVHVCVGLVSRSVRVFQGLNDVAEFARPEVAELMLQGAQHGGFYQIPPASWHVASEIERLRKSVIAYCVRLKLLEKPSQAGGGVNGG